MRKFFFDRLSRRNSSGLTGGLAGKLSGDLARGLSLGIIALSLLASPLAYSASAQTSDREVQNFTPLSLQNDSIQFYNLRYGLRDLFTKLVNDNGNGHEDLYGIRNFRMVLTGVAYRGGANNLYNRNGKRANSNPLPTIGLRNLCEEGFDQAVYLYSTNYGTAPHSVSCRTRSGASNTLTYFQYSPLLSLKAAHSILELIHAKLTNSANSHPLYMHCWNGWHASGYISALTLRQFCGMTADKAIDYWNQNTDGNFNGASYDKVRQMIRNYQIDPALSIPAAVEADICQYM